MRVYVVFHLLRTHELLHHLVYLDNCAVVTGAPWFVAYIYMSTETLLPRIDILPTNTPC